MEVEMGLCGWVGSLEIERRASQGCTVVSNSLGSGTLSLCGEQGHKGRDLLGRRKLSF